MAGRRDTPWSPLPLSAVISEATTPQRVTVPALHPAMALLLLPLLVLLLSASGSLAGKSLYDLAAVDIDGSLVSLSQYRGKVSLVINVASYCGLTKTNYEELVQMQKQLQGSPFAILAFPCNQFNAQEPKSNREIKEFAQGYGAHFPMFAKTTVNPPLCQGTADACDADSEACCPTNNIVYTFLKGVFEGPIQWNFEKFLVNDEGVPIRRYPPTQNPLSILPDIQAALSSIPGISGVAGTDSRQMEEAL